MRKANLEVRQTWAELFLIPEIALISSSRSHSGFAMLLEYASFDEGLPVTELGAKFVLSHL